MILPLPLFLFVLLELIAVAYLDVKYRVIKNLWSILNLVCATVLFMLFPDYYPLKFEMFQFSLAFFFVGFLLFLLKIMGGGDSKFLATFFLIIPFKLQESVFLYLLIITVIIGLLTLLKNIITQWNKLSESIKNRDVQGVKSCFGTKFPYAPVILITWVFLGLDLYLT